MKGATADRRGMMAGVVGTVAVHGLAVTSLLLAVRQSAAPTLGTVYEVKLVAAPVPTETKRLATEALSRPEEMVTPAKPLPKAKTVPVPKPKPKKALPDDHREAAAPTANPAKPLPGETPGSGTSVANVDTPGLKFPFPEYLQNIVEQVYRRWTRPLSSNALRAEVSFLIMRDGTVKDIRFTQSSRNYAFDVGAQGAIEAAANAHAFGALPGGFGADVLPVTFFFTPRAR